MRYRLASLVAIVSVASGSSLTLSAQAPSSRQEQTETIRRMLVELHDNGEFTGSVLVAQAGTVVYREAIAATPEEARTLLTSPSEIASVSKTFTAMAVMLLAEQGKLKYDDLVTRHVPELAGAALDITIRHLLTHTSGIPDVGDLGIDRPGVGERDVVSAVRAHHTRFARPGASYRYSNTGYMILGMVVERASGRPFDELLQRAIFEPLGMTNTRPDPRPRRAGETKGESGLVSTVDDLLKWERALAGESLVRQSAFAEAVAPARLADGESPYGFGWNVVQRDGQTYMWHSGNSGARRAFLGRRVRDGIAVIILTIGNSRRVEIADAIVEILNGRPHVPPKLSSARRLLTAIDKQSIDEILALYQQLRTMPKTRYDFSEPELNNVGYALLDRGRHNDAIRIFEMNVRQFPSSSNAFDSLGEALYRGGRRADAAKAYERAVELDPSNVSARGMLLKLK